MGKGDHGLLSFFRSSDLVSIEPSDAMLCCPRSTPTTPAITTVAAGGSLTVGKTTSDAQRHAARFRLHSICLSKTSRLTGGRHGRLSTFSRCLQPCSGLATLTTSTAYDHAAGGKHRRGSAKESRRENVPASTASLFSRSVSLSQQDLAIRKTGSRLKQVASGDHKPQNQVRVRHGKTCALPRDVAKHAIRQSVWDDTSDVYKRRCTNETPKTWRQSHGTPGRGSRRTECGDHGRYGHRITVSMTSHSCFPCHSYQRAAKWSSC
jgi:hypothetical protein